MKLIGMLDSPYVRRVAVCLDVLGVSFEHEAVSVFSTFERFQAINPVVKAPTLILDDGSVLMDSSLILQWVEGDRRYSRSPLWSADPAQRTLQFRTVSYGFAAAEKTQQLVYETNLRPPAAQYEPWKKRVHGQLTAAFAALESLTPTVDAAPGDEYLDHASILSAIVWKFAQQQIPELVPESRHPELARLSTRFEALPLFKRYPPDGPGVPGLQVQDTSA